MAPARRNKLLVEFVCACALVATLLPSASPAQGGIRVKDGEKICFLGDSITSGGAKNVAGYCRLVISGLKTHGINATMIPAGVSGHKSDQMLERLERDVLKKKPDWMTLSCGVNDVWHGDRGVKLPEYKKNITAIVDRAQAAGIKVMILTSTMIYEDQKKPRNQQLLPYNAFLRELAKAKGCLLADLNQVMQDALDRGPNAPPGNQLTTDGVHMNTLGNIMMAGGVLEAFGLSGEQLKKSRAAWESMDDTCSVRLDIKMSAATYRHLRKLAVWQGVSNVEGLFKPRMEKAMGELMKLK